MKRLIFLGLAVAAVWMLTRRARAAIKSDPADFHGPMPQAFSGPDFMTKDFLSDPADFHGPMPG